MLTDDGPTKARRMLRTLLAARIVMTPDPETGECRFAVRRTPETYSRTCFNQLERCRGLESNQ